MVKRMLIIVLTVLLLVATVGLAQCMTPDEKKDMTKVAKAMVEMCNKKVVTDIDIMEALSQALKEDKGFSGNEVLAKWVLLFWLESYYKDLSTLYPERRKNYEGGLTLCQLAIKEKFNLYDLAAKQPKAPANVKFVSEAIRCLYQETKTAYLKSSTRITR